MLGQRIADTFGLPRSVIDTIVDSAPHRYKVYRVAKKAGKGWRVIAQPSREVKAVQRYLVSNEIGSLPLHETAAAYRVGMGIGENAARHVNSHFLLKMDFKGFFPSLRPSDLEKHIEEFMPERFCEEDLRIIRKVCFWKPRKRSSLRLSIGACCSPFISNTVMYKFDECVDGLARERGIIYTRYADDLTLSTSKRNLLREMERAIRKILKELSYPTLTINEDKTIHSSKKHQRRVTGLVLSSQGRVSLGRNRKRDIVAAVHHALNGRLESKEVEKLKGQLAFAFDVEPEFLVRRGSRHRRYRRAACTRSRRWYGPWRCACCRHRRPSAGPPASAEGSSSVAVPAGSAPSPAPLPCVAAPACAASASLPSASAPPSPAPRSPSHPARCARQDGHPSSGQSTSHADGSPDGSRQTRKRPAKTSPRSEAGRHRSSRTAAIACRQPQDARSGRASSELGKSAARSSSGVWRGEDKYVLEKEL